MNKINFFRFLLLFFLFISYHAQAFSNKYVSDWAQNTLIQTLSVSYIDSPDENRLIQKKYSLAAWEPMRDFFSKELQIIEEQKLTIHPKPLTKPKVTRSNNCLSSDCWEVTQSYNLPELHMNVDFSLFIVSASPSNESPFLIQSANIKIHQY